MRVTFFWVTIWYEYQGIDVDRVLDWCIKSTNSKKYKNQEKCNININFFYSQSKVNMKLLYMASPYAYSEAIYLIWAPSLEL